MKVDFVHIGREHLGISYLSAVLKRAGHQVRLRYDPGLFGSEDNAFQIEPLAQRFDQSERIVRAIVSDPPDVLAFSIYTSTVRWALAVASAVREHLPQLPTVFGGIHATLEPERVVSHSAVDVVVRGEAEGVITELVQRLASDADWRQLPSLAYFEQGRLVQTPLAAPIADLDSLPLPDKQLFEEEIDHSAEYLMMSSRGCPFSCSYCCESAINRLYQGRFLRRRSVESVIDELRQARDRYGSRSVMFNDAVFISDKAWLMELLEQYRERIGLPFRCFGQVLQLDEEIARELKRAGCYCIELGLQTTNDWVRREQLNRRETLAQARAAFQICDRAALPYDIDHMWNLPTESVGDGIDALRLYSGLRCLNRVKVHFMTVFPGTAMMQIGLRDGWLSSERAERIRQGFIGDFFHDFEAYNSEMTADIRAFSRLFKALPLLPKGLVEWLCEEDRHRLFGHLPGPGVILLQLLVAARGRDYRYLLYIRYYYQRIARLLTR